MTIRIHGKLSPSHKFILFALVAAVLALAAPALASAAWTVDSTGDQADQSSTDGACKTAQNTCTLRAAIEESNAAGGSQEIFFGSAFDGKSGSTIVLGSALPAFAPERGEINGIAAGACTTSAAVAGPCVEIDGVAGTATLAVAGSNEVIVKGLALTGGATGLETVAGGAVAVEENWIGKKLDGTAAPATSVGIDADNEARILGNTIAGGAVGIHTGGVDPSGNSLRLNTISGASAAGILIENSSNQVFGNKVSGSGVGIRVHDGTASAEENKIGGVQFGSTDPDANQIDGSTGAAIEINTASGSVANRVLRNSGAGNGGPFIALVKKSSSESQGPNEGIQPPTIAAASLTAASGTAKPESFVRVYANATGSEGEMGTFLGLVEADSTTGAWSLTYSAPAATTKIAASQTADEDEGGSSALAFAALRFDLKVALAGSGSGTVTTNPSAIDCGTLCEASFAKGTLIHLLATSTSTSKPATWSGCDAISSANECEVTMTAAKSVTATFDLIPTGGNNDPGPTPPTSNPDPTPTPTPAPASPAPTPSPSPAPMPTKPAPPKAPQCKAGFKKKTVKGKSRCVKVKKAKKKKH